MADDLALHVRYVVGAETIALRSANRDVDPVSGGPPTHATRLASDIFHDLHSDPGVDAWRDEKGYRWWGDEPPGGWPVVVRTERVLTLTP